MLKILFVRLESLSLVVGVSNLKMLDSFIFVIVQLRALAFAMLLIDLALPEVCLGRVVININFKSVRRESYRPKCMCHARNTVN